MDEFRYALGLVLIFIMPVVIMFWLVIHLGAVYWRQKKPVMAYCVAGIFILLTITVIYFLKHFLLGHDLGTNLFLFTIGILIYLASWFLWRPVKRYLDFKTFAGMPEVNNEKIALIKGGPFAIVRHPRYLMVLIGILGWCLISNYSGVYIMGFASLFGMMLIMQLEERDLIKRFGKEYTQYQKEVPQFLPTLSGAKRFLKENF